MMIWHRWMSRQFRKPSGVLGHLAAARMARNNPQQYEKVIELLTPADQDSILEIGCGAGRALRMIAERNAACRIDGIDFSGLMLKKAKKLNRPEIRQGRVRLIGGNFGEHDFHSTRYSKIFAINVVYFWENLGGSFAKIRNLLQPSGRLVLYMSGPERLAQMPFALDGVFNKYPLETVREELLRAGFVRVFPETVLQKGLATYFIAAE